MREKSGEKVVKSPYHDDKCRGEKKDEETNF